MRAFTLLFLFLFACQARPAVQYTPTASNMCYRSFGSVLQYWEKTFGHAPEQCRKLDQIYKIQFVDASHMVCGPKPPPGIWTVACTTTTLNLISILKDHRRSELQMIDASVHEWVHALNHCVFKTLDKEHTNPKLWEGYGTQAIVTQAQSEMFAGTCL